MHPGPPRRAAGSVSLLPQDIWYIFLQTSTHFSAGVSSCRPPKPNSPTAPRCARCRTFASAAISSLTLLRALPPPPPDAPVAWRHAHLQGIIEEVRALDPRDPLEAMLVGAHHCRPSRGRGVGAHVPRSDAVGAAGGPDAPQRGGAVAGGQADGAHAEEASRRDGAPRVRRRRRPRSIWKRWTRSGAGWPARRLSRGLTRQDCDPVVMRGVADPRPRRRARRGGKPRRPPPSRGSNIQCVGSGSTWCGWRPYRRRGRRDHVQPGNPGPG